MMWAAFTTVAHFCDEFVDMVKHDNTLYAKIIKDANIRVEQ